MKGKVIIIPVIGDIVEQEYDHADLSEVYQEAVGGWIETVPYLDEYKGKPCIAYCNEEGKIDGLPYNERATKIWELTRPKNSIIPGDHLVGPVVIIQGDEEFMAAQ